MISFISKNNIHASAYLVGLKMNNLQINFVNFVVICDKNRKELNIKKIDMYPKCLKTN